jgi:hypothetical protein
MRQATAVRCGDRVLEKFHFPWPRRIRSNCLDPACNSLFRVMFFKFMPILIEMRRRIFIRVRMLKVCSLAIPLLLRLRLGLRIRSAGAILRPIGMPFVDWFAGDAGRGRVATRIICSFLRIARSTQRLERTAQKFVEIAMVGADMIRDFGRPAAHGA